MQRGGEGAEGRVQRGGEGGPAGGGEADRDGVTGRDGAPGPKSMAAAWSKARSKAGHAFIGGGGGGSGEDLEDHSEAARSLRW